MTPRAIFRTVITFGGAALALCAGPALAEMKPVTNPNGSFSGTIDGHAIDIPVHCYAYSPEILSVSSHDQLVVNRATVGGIEPVVGVMGTGSGYQTVVFIGGERYKFMQIRNLIETFPHTLKRTVRAGKKVGKVDVDFTLDCKMP